MEITPCLMCGNTSHNKTIELAERMYGSHETFDYIECGACGSLQIASIPTDMGRFYPRNYYSFRSLKRGFKSSVLRTFVRKRRTEYRVLGKGLFGKLVAPPPEQDWFARDYTWEWFKTTSTTADSRVLDVGCGAGALLFSMRDQGFDRLTGVDPFLDTPIAEPGIKLLKCTVHELNDSFDLVMAHHSLEHMMDPGATLAKMRDLCQVGGWIIVRIPVLGDSWKRYGACWVELDAPRHFFIPSVDGLRALVAGIDGLEMKNIDFDTKQFEIAGSELYVKNVPLRQQPLGTDVPLTDHFSPAELSEFSARATALNASRTAGRAVFYLQRTK